MAVLCERVDMAQSWNKRTLCLSIPELVGQRLPLALGQ
jgi:hypothetical protein